MIELHTSMGDLTIELDSERTPQTAENFKRYVEEGFYDQTIFHRVIDGFMIQGGGFSSDMVQKSAHAPIENEAHLGGSNTRGSIAMARLPDPHSASAQFFINVKDNAFLNHRSKTPEGWGYCVFGQVVKGMDVIDEIKRVKTGSRVGHQDVPLEEVILISAKGVLGSH